MASPGSGDGYAVVTTGGLVGGFGTVSVAGQTSGAWPWSTSPSRATAPCAWVLRLPTGRSRRWGAPRRSARRRRPASPVSRSSAGLLATATGCSQQTDARGYGAAKTLGAASGSGTPVDLAITGSGSGVLVLYDSGVVVALGKAAHGRETCRRVSRSGPSRPWRSPPSPPVGTSSAPATVDCSPSVVRCSAARSPAPVPPSPVSWLRTADRLTRRSARLTHQGVDRPPSRGSMARMPVSYLTTNARGGASMIDGRGVICVAPIECGRGGRAFGGRCVRRDELELLPRAQQTRSMQIDDDLYLAGRSGVGARSRDQPLVRTELPARRWRGARGHARDRPGRGADPRVRDT